MRRQKRKGKEEWRGGKGEQRRRGGRSPRHHEWEPIPIWSRLRTLLAVPPPQGCRSPDDRNSVHLELLQRLANHSKETECYFLKEELPWELYNHTYSSVFPFLSFKIQFTNNECAHGRPILWWVLTSVYTCINITLIKILSISTIPEGPHVSLSHNPTHP